MELLPLGVRANGKVRFIEWRRSCACKSQKGVAQSHGSGSHSRLRKMSIVLAVGVKDGM